MGGNTGKGLRAVCAGLTLAIAGALVPTLAAADPEAIEQTVELDAPLELVWHVLTDFAAWPRFMPNLKRIDVVGSAQQPTALRYSTESVGIAIGFTARTDVRSDVHRLDIALDESAPSDIAAMRASWQLTPLGGGLVRVQFRSAIDSGQPVPEFIQRRVLRTSVEATIRSFANEVERRVKGDAATSGA